MKKPLTRNMIKRLSERKAYCLSLRAHPIYDRLRMVVNNPKIARLATKGHCYKSLCQLIINGYTYTYKWRKYKHQSINWTDEVCNILYNLDIPYRIINMLPIDGQYEIVIAITDKDFIDAIEGWSNTTESCEKQQ